MDVNALKNSPIGQLVSITGQDALKGRYDYFAFLPDPLSGAPDLTPETWTAASDAALALGRLQQASLLMPNPGLLVAPALAREAVSTSALEGTYAALPDVLEARLPQRKPGSAEVAEIRAYEDIAWQAFAWVKSHPISVGLLCELQGKLARTSRRPVRDPGLVRTHQVFIGPEGSSVYDARFVPPPPGDQLQLGLDAWQKWITNGPKLPAVVAAAMAHYQFETLHPFGDGNGRIGRLVVVLQLLGAGVLPEPAFSISPWLLKRRTEYQDHLLHLSQTGDWNPWIQFFCQAVRDQADAHVTVAQRILEWLTEVRKSLNEHRWSGTIVQLVNDLIDWPVITLMFTAQKYEVSVPTAKSAIDRLVELGVLEEMTGKTYNRVFGARAVIDLVESL
jgi:Fic family protein